MTKAVGLLSILAVAAAAVAFMKQGEAGDQSTDPELRFREASQFSVNEIAECVTGGNGKELFENFDPVFLAAPKGPPAEHLTFRHPNGSRIMVTPIEDGAALAFRSARPLEELQEDPLKWCAERANTTWIAPQYRAGS